MMSKEERSLFEAYSAIKENRFWKLFLAELNRKRDYYTSRISEADSWEEICRLQGGLSVCRQLILLAEQAEKGEQQ